MFFQSDVIQNITEKAKSELDRNGPLSILQFSDN